MDYIKISKSVVNDVCTIPSSKSYSIRALFAALLNCKEAKLYNVSNCEDSLATIEVIKKLGAKIKIERKSDTSMDLTVKGTCGLKNEINKSSFNCGESGLCARMLIPILGLIGNDKYFTVTGKGSLLKRPFNAVYFLEDFGLNISLKDNKLPALVKGRLSHNNEIIDLSLTTQFFSGLLMSLPIIEGKSILRVINKTSVPYVMATLDVMKECNIRIKFSDDLTKFEVIGGQNYSFSEYTVENDWSGATYILVAGAIAGNIGVKGLNFESFQADSVIVDILKEVGASVEYKNDILYVSKINNTYKPFKFDANNSPDIVPTLTTLATQCDGISEINNVNRLKYKESNRIKSLIEAFTNIGIKIWYEPKNNGTLYIKSGKIKGGIVDPENDHRIAMTLAVAGLVSEEGVIIKIHHV
ncbi:3-phosphoshikimate 1-carboxyvinyltransferase [Marinitoga lauensis]|uniref:3-phosphoshikimate 1-carboxyvinyltransferase n=1 Tax=Marinitoga lauensis TaxID=2201189 RepID=UPI0010133E19|nr:3-phosphoshikimate 1-carboxyvinyltransferase [Marinitoga lauensis]